MKRLILGYVQNNHWSGAHELCENEILFVPLKILTRNGQQEFNCDAAFLTGMEQTSDSDQYSYLFNSGISVIGGTRLSKLEQHLLFNRLGIPCPRYYYIWSDIKSNVVSLLASVEDEKFLVVKSLYGARGLQQFLIKKKDFVSKYPYETLEIKSNSEGKKDNPTSIREPDAIPGGDAEEEFHSLEFFKKPLSNFLITEKVNIKREFRILFFSPDNYLICERHLHPNHFQNNLSLGAEVSYYRKDWSLLEAYKERIQDYAGRIHNHLPHLPYFSMDVFVTENEEVGMFEFSQEFGYRACNVDDVRKYALEGILSVFNRSKIVF